MSTRDVDEGLKPHGTVTLIGRGGDAADSARDFLERNGVALRWIDLDHDPLGGMLPREDLGGVSLPLAIFADGTRLEASRARSTFCCDICKLQYPSPGFGRERDREPRPSGRNQGVSPYLIAAE